MGALLLSAAVTRRDDEAVAGTCDQYCEGAGGSGARHVEQVDVSVTCCRTAHLLDKRSVRLGVAGLRGTACTGGQGEQERSECGNVKHLYRVVDFDDSMASLQHATTKGTYAMYLI
jgi:hypothetical protein